MNNLDVDEFLFEIETSVKLHFKKFKISFLIKTPNSLKAKVMLEEKTFIALRYNARNGRIDFALIHNHQRIFGYDNLKEWHFHPYSNPSKHINCKKTTINNIIFDIREVYEIIKNQ